MTPGHSRVLGAKRACLPVISNRDGDRILSDGYLDGTLVGYGSGGSQGS
jgi:hypothetical protein